MTKNEETLVTILLIPLFMIGTLKIVVPTVQSIWMMLVYPTTHYPLSTGVVLFTSIAAGLLKYKLEDENQDLKHTISFAV